MVASLLSATVITICLIRFHIVNTVLHVIATALFQALCEKIVFHKGIVRSPSARRSLAWVAGAFYGIHPIHVECVTNIVGRAEPLSAIFFILCIFAARSVCCLLLLQYDW